MGVDPPRRTWPEVKEAYWRHHRLAKSRVDREPARPSPSDRVPDEDFWSWEYVDNLWRTGDQAALDHLVDLAESASDDDELCYLGAGPVEDFVRVFGVARIDDIEAAARRSPPFLRALQGMYGIVIPEPIRVRMLPLVPVSVAENRIRLYDGKTSL